MMRRAQGLEAHNSAPETGVTQGRAELPSVCPDIDDDVGAECLKRSYKAKVRASIRPVSPDVQANRIRKLAQTLFHDHRKRQL
jgi:hypothetical protein